MHSFPSLYNENTVISKEYTGPLDFDITKLPIYRSDTISVHKYEFYYTFNFSNPTNSPHKFHCITALTEYPQSYFSYLDSSVRFSWLTMKQKR